MTLGRAGGGAAAAAGLHLALGWALIWPPILVECCVRSIITQYGGGVRLTLPNPVEFPFFIISQFSCH